MQNSDAFFKTFIITKNYTCLNTNFKIVIALPVTDENMSLL